MNQIQSTCPICNSTKIMFISKYRSNNNGKPPPFNSNQTVVNITNREERHPVSLHIKRPIFID